MSKDPFTSNKPVDRRFRPRRLRLPGGETLFLRGSGVIDQVDDAGTTTRSWPIDDPDWPGVAIRFGIRATDVTIAPSSRLVQQERLP